MIDAFEEIQDETDDAQFDEDDEETDPTAIAYGELRIAFQHFNIDLFDNRLPECLITLQRRRSSYGYFSPDRFKEASSNLRVDEIALNPQKWRKFSIED